MTARLDPADDAQERLDRGVVVDALARLRHALGGDDLRALEEASLPKLRLERHGDLLRWWTVVESISPHSMLEGGFDSDLNAPSIRIGRAELLQPAQRAELRQRLLQLLPWRKGPFDVFGIHVDTEWRSSWKWARFADAVAWTDRSVLDVGCGNGYYALRAVGAGARAVLGVDPSTLFVVQFALLSGWTRPPAAVMPLCLEDLPPLDVFDVVLSLGVLGHRRDPLQHLEQLRRRTARRGQLVLETLIVERPDSVFEPRGRYAAMRNVWQLPSCDRLCAWLKQTGWSNLEVLDVTATTTDEQRSTEWMPFQSLAEFLDPSDPTRTREGHPAPQRAVVIARAE